MKRLFFLLWIFPFIVSLSIANTTRDIKPAPYYNPEQIKKLVILYLNIERINSSKPALVINKKLNSAAQWHSDYMSEVQLLIHVADRKGMHDVSERVTSFTDRTGICAELISFSYSLSANGIPFELKKDKDGEYTDFGSINVNWQSNTEIAMSMVRNILQDRLYREYLFNISLNSIGGGITPGKSRGLDGWYASFALVQKTDILMVICKSSMKKEIIKKNIDGKEIAETVLDYKISGFHGEKVSILAINSSGVYRVFGTRQADREYRFRIDDEFRSGITNDEKLYIATYDADNDTYYPVMRIEVLE